MKRNIMVIILSAWISVFLTGCAFIKPIFNSISQGNSAETFLSMSKSPDGKYTLEAYRTEPGATVDFSVKVYLIDDGRKKLIYNAYHEDQANFIWIDNDNVSINERTLNLAIGETYDWRDHLYK